ncbi:BEN domain-containing protein 5-like [Pseudorasbora parva]|uniref:BEN domain-containing protein 5-like n=1 Tax=Pseudorasbora parva TaxID=51549 RepID=UPI00351E485C
MERFPTNQKKTAEVAKRNNLLALLKERKMKRKQSPLCPTPSKTMRAHTLSDSLSEEDDDNDGGGVVPEKLFEEARQKQQLYLKKLNNMFLQLQETKNKLEEQEKMRAEVEAENKELRSLNMQLQQQLLKKLKSSSTANCSDPGLPSPKETIPKSGCLIEVEPFESPKVDEIHLGGGIRVRREAWSRIGNSTRDSLFVKELAVAIWGTKTLGERSLTGKECPTTKTTRQPLTPQKLQTLKVCFKEWLEKKNVEETELQARWGKAGRFITEKIMDINRQKKKTNC